MMTPPLSIIASCDLIEKGAVEEFDPRPGSRVETAEEEAAWAT